MARAGSAASALATVAGMRATLSAAAPSSSYSTYRPGTTTWGFKSTKQATTSTDLVMPGDIFQGAGTAGYTENGAIAPDSAAMDKAGQQSGFALPSWVWLVGGVAVLGGAGWYFLRKRA